MLRVACVLRSGGDYKVEHVLALHQQVKQHLRRTPYKFACFMDKPSVEVEVLGEVHPLTQGWPGWWSKIELFDGRLSGPVLYFDLDTVLVRPIDDLALGHRFTVLQNFLFSDRMGSGMMAWREDLRAVYDRFKEDPARWMRDGRKPMSWGDQAFIHRHSPIRPQTWQQLHPGKVVSFKVHCLPERRVPDRAAVVCFHGRPRPWNLSGTDQAWFGMTDASSVPA